MEGWPKYNIGELGNALNIMYNYVDNSIKT